MWLECELLVLLRSKPKPKKQYLTYIRRKKFQTNIFFRPQQLTMYLIKFFPWILREEFKAIAGYGLLGWLILSIRDHYGWHFLQNETIEKDIILAVATVAVSIILMSLKSRFSTTRSKRVA